VAAVATKGRPTISWDITPCSLREINRFGGNYLLYPQGRRVREISNQEDAGIKQNQLFQLHTFHWLIACLLFDPEDRDSITLRNIGGLHQVYSGLYSRRYYFPNGDCIDESIRLRLIPDRAA
jgi:hypothetical protein